MEVKEKERNRMMAGNISQVNNSRTINNANQTSNIHTPVSVHTNDAETFMLQRMYAQ